MHHCGDHAGSGRNRHPNKIFLARASRIGWLRVGADVETGEAAGSGHQEQKTSNAAQLREFDVPCREQYRRDAVKAPGPGQHGGGNPECDYICQRVEFSAEVAAGAGHAGDAAIKTVEQNSEAYGDGCMVKVPVLVGDRVIEDLHNRIKARSHIPAGEQRREYVHALAHAARALLVLPASWGWEIHQRAPSVTERPAVSVSPLSWRHASTLAPPRILSPIFTCSEAAAST